MTHWPNKQETIKELAWAICNDSEYERYSFCAGPGILPCVGLWFEATIAAAFAWGGIFESLCIC